MDKLDEIDLINKKKFAEKKLNTLSYGAIEIREIRAAKYIYLHRRINGLNKSIYLGEYSDELHDQIIKNNLESKLLKKQIRDYSKQLNKVGYVEKDLSAKVQANIDYAKRNLLDTIYKQAILEGITITFLNVKAIIEGGKINGLSVDDANKINNMKHAWQFILNDEVISSPFDYNILWTINKLIEEGFYYNAGTIRTSPISVAGTKWQPLIPIESVIKKELQELLNSYLDIYTKAINILLYILKKQIFIGGNKRAAIIFTNYVLISTGSGLLVIPDDKVSEFNELLVHYYETDKKINIIQFLIKYCIIKI